MSARGGAHGARVVVQGGVRKGCLEGSVHFGEGFLGVLHALKHPCWYVGGVQGVCTHPRVVPEASCTCKGGHPRLGSAPLAALEYVLEADKERHPPRVRFLGTHSATYRGLFTMPDTRCESKELLLLVSARWSRRGRGAGGEERWKCWPWGFVFFRVSRWGFAVIADPPPPPSPCRRISGTSCTPSCSP